MEGFFFFQNFFFSPESSFNEIERKRFVENEGGARVRNDFGTWS